MMIIIWMAFHTTGTISAKIPDLPLLPVVLSCSILQASASQSPSPETYHNNNDRDIIGCGGRGGGYSLNERMEYITNDSPKSSFFVEKEKSSSSYHIHTLLGKLMHAQ